jgi:GNAT superfamily N-acetyltransferase
MITVGGVLQRHDHGRWGAVSGRTSRQATAAAVAFVFRDAVTTPSNGHGRQGALVPRTPVAVRTAGSEDLPALLELARELRDVGARTERAVNPVAIIDLAGRLEAAIAGTECRVVLATVDGAPAGMALFRAVQPDPLSESVVLQMSHVVVAKPYQRRGVGHALGASAAEVADELGIEHVAVSVYPSLRDASRFYARLGFAAVSTRRVAPVAVLRRRLGVDGPLARVDDLVRRRSRARRPLPVQRATRARREPVD